MTPNPKQEQAGVGIIFKPSFHSECFMALVVHDLVVGSSAEKLGAIQHGDMLQSIDGIDVFRRPAQEVSGGLPLSVRCPYISLHACG
jgi:hypothetical protein